MKCEYCDSIIREVPDNGVCPNCGGVLRMEREQPEKKPELVFPKPPIKIHNTVYTSVQLDDKGIMLKKKYPLSEKIERYIPYRETVAVSFTEGKGLRGGVLCIRTKHDIHIPFSCTSKQEHTDSGAVFLGANENEIYRKIYLFLKQCADIVNAQEESEYV